jgi:hypothetical protein
MARFEVTTPVPDHTGRVGETQFVKGRAEVDSDTREGLSALSYFHAQGYGIRALGDVSVEDAVHRQLDPADEAKRLERENASLKRRLELGDLRAENERLRKQVERENPEPANPDIDGQGNVGSKLGGPAPAPADDAPIAEWRAYAVAELGVSEPEAKKLDKGQIMERDRTARERAEGVGR